MRCLTVFAIFMWLLVVSWSSDYWFGISPRVTLIALVDVEVCLGIPSCVTRWVPRESRGLILGSTGRGRPILGSTGRGRPLLYPTSVFPTSNVINALDPAPLHSDMISSLGSGHYTVPRPVFLHLTSLHFDWLCSAPSYHIWLILYSWSVSSLLNSDFLTLSHSFIHCLLGLACLAWIFFLLLGIFYFPLKITYHWIIACIILSFTLTYRLSNIYLYPSLKYILQTASLQEYWCQIAMLICTFFMNVLSKCNIDFEICPK